MSTRSFVSIGVLLRGEDSGRYGVLAHPLLVCHWRHLFLQPLGTSEWCYLNDKSFINSCIAIETGQASSAAGHAYAGFRLNEKPR